MNNYVFDKQIKLDEVASKVINIKLKENFDYINLVNDLHIVGKIDIEGIYLSGEHQLPFKGVQDIDLLIPQENVKNMYNIKLNVKSYDTHLVDNNINIKITCNLSGYDYTKDELEIQKTFQEVIETLDKDTPNSLLDQFRDQLSEDDEKKFYDMINGDVEVFDTTAIEETPDETESEEENTQDDVSEDSNQEQISEEPLILEPVEEVQSEVIENKIIEIKEKQETNKHSSLFSEERFVVFSRFYRVRSVDTYESIAGANSVDPEKLKSLNKNKELHEGMLIQIPR